MPATSCTVKHLACEFDGSFPAIWADAARGNSPRSKHSLFCLSEIQKRATCRHRSTKSPAVSSPRREPNQRQFAAARIGMLMANAGLSSATACESSFVWFADRGVEVESRLRHPLERRSARKSVTQIEFYAQQEPPGEFIASSVERIATSLQLLDLRALSACPIYVRF